jgi:large subunit ribosomal protein L28
MKMKRQILMTLATGNYYPNDEEKQQYIREKYADFLMPLEEAEWVGLDLNEACRKQQDLEDDLAPEPEKYLLERELLQKLESGEDLVSNEGEYVPKTQKSVFAEKSAFGRAMKTIEDKVSRR